MDFSINFMKRATVVLQEALKLKKYKAMPVALAVIVGILMLPIIIAGFVCAAVLYILGYFFSVVSLPTQRLHKLLHDEGQSVQHATQFVMYFLSWTFVFSTYALLSFFLIVLTVLYSVFSILTYIWTLGGFKFHVFASEEDISIEVEGKYSTAIAVIFIAVMAALYVLLPAYKTLSLVIDYDIDVTFKMLWRIFKVQVQTTGGWRFLFSAIYSALVFAPNPKKIEE